jgi:hypothetical protein
VLVYKEIDSRISGIGMTIVFYCSFTMNSKYVQHAQRDCAPASDQSVSREQVVDIIELVEKELLSQPAVKPILRDPLISDPHAIRVKDDGQLIQELDILGKEVLQKYPQIGSTIEEAIMKSLFMWHGCLNINKECRLKDVHGVESQNRMQVHDWLVSQSNSNPWIRKGLTSAKYFRPHQKNSKDYSWIPPDSLYW